MEIPMQKSGIYIVKTGTKTQKVMIQQSTIETHGRETLH